MDQGDRLDKARRAIVSAKDVVFFTGSGISAESGIPTFRDAGGIWDKYPPEEFAHMPALLRIARRQPQTFASFLHDFLEPLILAQPNDAHKAIGAFQGRNSSLVITQNVDALHQRGGATKVVELHGSMFEAINVITRNIRQISRREMQLLVDRLKILKSKVCGQFEVYKALVPLAQIGPTGLWLPNVVLFGQSLPKPAWRTAVEAVNRCDCLVIVGTSMQVFPANTLVDIALSRGISVIQVDVAASGSEFALKGTACSVLPRLCARGTGLAEV